MERESFVFYRSFYEASLVLDDDSRLEFYDAVIGYGCDGDAPEFESPIAAALFRMAKPQIDANNLRYEGAKKGGRPKKDKYPCTKEEYINTAVIPDSWRGYQFPKAWRDARYENFRHG